MTDAERITELTKERDTWREMAMNLMKYLPAPQPVHIPTPAPIAPHWWLTPICQNQPSITFTTGTSTATAAVDRAVFTAPVEFAAGVIS